MASPKRFLASIARIHVRVLWLQVQRTRSQHRTHEDWLMAANRELFEKAAVKIGLGGVVTTEVMEKPNEKIGLNVSFEGLCGIKLAVVNGAKDAAFRERLDLLEAADSFGTEFAKLVRKAAKLPESDELDEEAELDGVPAVDDKKEVPLA